MKRKHLMAAILSGLFSLSIQAQSLDAAKSTAEASATNTILVNSPNDRIHIYPNPSHGTFYFNGIKNSTIEISNLMGQKVLTAEADRDRYPVDLSVHARGIYSYRILHDGIVLQQGKVVVE